MERVPKTSKDLKLNLVFFPIWGASIIATNIIFYCLTLLTTSKIMASMICISCLTPFCLTNKTQKWLYWSFSHLIVQCLVGSEGSIACWLILHCLSVLSIWRNERKMDLNILLGGHSSFIFKRWPNLISSGILLVLLFYQNLNLVLTWYVSHFLAVLTFKHGIKMYC